MDGTAPLGRRARKKAATRQAIADAARRLFLQQGFDRVSVKTIADAADVSLTTLFKHFPSKEALFFDEEGDRQAELIAAVRNRGAQQSIPQALLHYIRHTYLGHALQREFLEFVRATPALEAYLRHMVVRYEQDLAHAVASEIGAPPEDAVCAAFARFALEAVNIARNHPEPETALASIFALLEHGWTAALERERKQ
jgi:AcrR family transcriptional regulator